MLLPYAASIEAADRRLADEVTPLLLAEIASALPAAWLGSDDPCVYVDYLTLRLEAPRGFVEEAERARG